MKKILWTMLLITTFLFASQGNHTSELSVTVGGVKPEGNLDLENKLNLGLRYGVYVQDLFFDVVEGGFERASGVKYDNSNDKTDINRLFVNLVKEYDLSKDTALYSLVGIGYEDYRNPMFDNDDDGFVQYGVGVKQWITDSFALKAEVRHGITFGGDNNLFYNVGFVIPFGKKVQTKIPIKSEVIVEEKKPEPQVVVKEEPKPEPKPVALVVLKDDDNDGVLNENDFCPKTAPKKVVDEKGCLKIVRLHVKFDYNKSDIPQSHMDEIESVVNFMKENNNYSVILEGHTDSIGSEEYNMALSLRRANAVANVMVKQGIDRKKITVKGYGETSPIATNKTEDGRAQNRRVDTTFTK